ncbi:putative F-box protein At1g53550 [Papaver somniferum]|uniref:putative F-box protein At1g53550 n=1 Tax=Papaver somniferum TaxID=3469 RepID=UPI000E6FE7D9|nr:putative F-box protein At1g53550 [Papaver somniferum]
MMGRRMEYFNFLPDEITLDIISRLPTENVLKCKLVCRNWRSLIRHPSFSKMHLHHLYHPAADSGKLGFITLTYPVGRKKGSFQYFEYDENHESIERIRKFNFKSPFGEDTIYTTFLGSLNGLICVTRHRFGVTETCICNPITREYIMLPEISRVGMNRGISGYGYVSSTNEYKVVRIMYENKTEVKEVYVYTLGSGNGWRNIGKLNFESIALWEEGVFVKGVLYWLDCEFRMIVPFNLAEEKFCKNLSLPFPPDYNSADWYKLGVLDGCLSFAINKNVNGGECWDVCLLKKKDDNLGMIEQEGHQSLGWNKEFGVYDKAIFAVTKRYGVLTFNGNHINIHDLEATTSKTVVDFEERLIGVFPHKNILVSLKELGEEDTKMMEAVKLRRQKAMISLSTSCGRMRPLAPAYKLY